MINRGIYLPEPLPADEHDDFTNDEEDELDDESWGGDFEEDEW